MPYPSSSSYFTVLLCSFFCPTVILAQAVCPRGTFLSLPSLDCVPCPPGTFQSSLNASVCSSCPAGSFQPSFGAQTSAACRGCSPGTFSTAGSSACFTCPPSTSSAARSALCVTCPPGTFLSAIGSFLPFESPCLPCDGGFTDMPNQLFCTSCPAGTEAPVGASSLDECTISCAPGTEPTPTGCRICAPNTFSSDGVKCLECPIGTISTSNSSFCVPCKSGERGVEANLHASSLTRCEPCPPGTSSFSPGAIFCRQNGNPCPREHLEVSSGDCIRCPVDYRYDAVNERCVRCDVGQGSAGGLPLTCAACDKVIRAHITQSRCFKNAPGIVVENGQDGLCPVGTRTDSEWNRCIACEAGTFSAVQNATECTLCPAGSVQADIGQASCTPCTNGTVAERSSSLCVVPQTNCPPGTKLVSTSTASSNSTTANADVCLALSCDLPPNSAEVAKSRKCGKCARSQSLDNTNMCSTCPNDAASDGKFCVKCGNGFVRDGDECACRGALAQNKGIVDGFCRQCPPGSYGKSGDVFQQNTCVQCPAGSFRNLENDILLAACAMSGEASCPKAVPCQTCPPNTVAREPGATQCVPCPPGTFSYGVGETECLREGGASEPVLFNDPIGLVDDQFDEVEESSQPVPDLDENDMTSSTEPVESPLPQSIVEIEKSLPDFSEELPSASDPEQMMSTEPSPE